MENEVNFKQFLLEAAVSKTPQYVKVDAEKAIALLNAHCKNALWMLEENAPIYRGDTQVKFPNSGFMVVDTEATERKSENTTNFYTIILDNHPDRKNFPKRSRSFIASTDKDYASGYATWPQEPYVIIPADDAKIGFVNNEDAWDTPIKLFGESSTIDRFNTKFDYMLKLRRSPVINDFYEFDKLLKNSNPEALKSFKTEFDLSNGEVKAFKDHFLDNIWKAYSAKSTGHTAHTTATMPHKSRSEVWVGGKVVLIKMNVWDKMRQAIKQEKKK